MTKLNYYFDWDRMTAAWSRLQKDGVDDAVVETVSVESFRGARGVYEAVFARNIAWGIADHEAKLAADPEETLWIDYNEAALYALGEAILWLDERAVDSEDVVDLLLDAYCDKYGEPDLLTEAEARAVAATWVQREER